MVEQTQLSISDSNWVVLWQELSFLFSAGKDGSFCVDNIVLLQFREQKEINIKLGLVRL